MSCLFWFFEFRGFPLTARIYRRFGAHYSRHDIQDTPLVSPSARAGRRTLSTKSLYPIQVRTALFSGHHQRQTDSLVRLGLWKRATTIRAAGFGFEKSIVFDAGLFARDDVAEEGEGGSLFDVDWNDVADESRVSVENDDVVGVRASAQLGRTGRVFALPRFQGVLAEALDQDVHGFVDSCLVVFEADGVLDGEEFVVAAFLDVVGDVVLEQVVALGAGTGAVFEDEAVFETAIANEVAGLFEGFFGLAAEAHDEVAADGDAGDFLAAAVEHVAVSFDRVHSLHAFEDFVATGLGGDVEVFADLRQVVDGVEQVVGHVVGEVRDELDSLDAFGVVNLVEQVREAEPASVVHVVFVAVDCLAEECDFLAAFARELDDFPGDVVGVSALFGATSGRDDAIRAKFVAADHDADERLVRCGTHGRVAHRVVAFEALLDFVAGVAA